MSMIKMRNYHFR